MSQAFDSHLAFASATVYQERNPHNFLADFESEIPGYLGIGRIVDVLDGVSSSASKMFSSGHAMQPFLPAGFISEADVELCRDWLDDLQSIQSNWS